jgi:hypothetical protein
MCVENYTRWPIVQAVESADSTTVANYLYEKVFCVFGPMISILSDNGSHFDNEVVDKFLTLVKTKHLFTSP